MAHRPIWVVAGVAAVLWPAGMAVAGDPIPFSYSSDSATIPAKGRAGVDVLCPEGRSVVGGGVSTTGSGLRTALRSTAPLDGDDDDAVPDDGWSGVAKAGSSDETVTTTAVCVQDDADLAYITRSKPIPPGHGIVGARARCPGGLDVTAKRIRAGGVEVTGDRRSEVGASGAADNDDSGSNPDNGWYGRAKATDERQTITTTAICEDAGFDQPTNPGFVGRRKRKTLTLPCPVETEFAVGGGARPGGLGKERRGQAIASAAPYDSIADPDSIPDDGFRVDVINRLNTAVPVESEVICGPLGPP